MTAETGSGKGREEAAAAATAAVRTWFNNHGWRMPTDGLRVELKRRGVDAETIADLLDDAVERQRTTAQEARQRGRATAPDRDNGAVPSQNLEAEEHILGSIIQSPVALETCRRIISDEGAEFYLEKHARIWRAAIARHDREPASVDLITLADELERRGDLDTIGGRPRLGELVALVPATANVARYARIVVETAGLRGFERVGKERPTTIDDAIVHAEQLIGELRARADAGRERIRIIAAADFLASKTDTVGVLLGDATDKVLPDHGFGLVYGKGAAGKTTLVTTMIAALASATPWLGITVPRPSRILMIENEGPKAPYIEKLERFAHQWDGPDFLHNVSFYEEPWGRFNLADRGMRDDLLAYTRDQHIDLVAAGPLRGLGMNGPGAPSETDAFLNLLKEAGLGTELAWLIVHHTNKAGQISGDWDRQPDLLIRYTYTGKRRNELIWEKIRWGDQGRQPLILEWLDQGVGYRIIDTTIPDIDWDELEAKVLDAIAAKPGCSQRTVEDGSGAKGERAREVIRRLLERGLIEDRGTGKPRAPRQLYTTTAPKPAEQEEFGF